MKFRLNYIVIPFTIFAISILGGFFTQSGMDWYRSINLPAWTPGGDVIGLAWTIIFILSAISLLIFWNKAERGYKFKIILGTFIVNGILNLAWSFIFFNQNFIDLAVFDAGLLALSVLILMVELWSISKTSSLLLLPYFLWTVFATILNFNILLIN